MRISGQLFGATLVASGALCGVGLSPAGGQVNQEAIDAVLSGKEKVAKAAWWGFDGAKATEALQSAIDSGAEKVIVENMGAPWIVDKIQLAGNQELVFEEGVVVEAKRGAFRGTSDSLFSGSLKENITLTGYGATLRMHRADYAGADYDKGEWRHVLSFLSCTDVTVSGLTLAESGGDGIYIGVGKAGVPCTNVTIKDVVCDRNYRQGISVISAENLLIENCVLRDTSGTAPSAGIDFEPNHANEPLVNCVMRECVVENNHGDGYEFYLNAMDGTSRDVSIRLENCRSIGNNHAVRIGARNGGPEGTVGGSIEFVDCTFEGSRSSGIAITQKPADGCRVQFADCSALGCGQEAPHQSPVMLSAGHGNMQPVGGVEFAGCRIVDPLDRQPLSHQDWAGGLPVIDVTGTLIVERDGERRTIEITDELLDEWMPSRKLKTITPYDMTGADLEPLVPAASPEQLMGTAMRIRNVASWVLWAKKGEQVAVTIRSLQVGRYAATPVFARAIGPSGNELVEIEAPFGEDTVIEFSVAETGVHGLMLDSGAHTAHVVGTTHPACVSVRAEPAHFLSATGNVYFWVPPHVKEFGVRVFGEGGEGVRAALYDADDNLIEDRDNITQPHQFVIERETTQEGEVWRLNLSKATDAFLEDYYVQLLGVPPLLAPAREALLVPAEE